MGNRNYFGEAGAEYLFGGAAADGNVFDGAFTFYLYDMNGSTIRYSHNRITGAENPVPAQDLTSAVFRLLQGLGGPQPDSTLTIEHNTIDANGGYDTIFGLSDWNPLKSAAVTVSSNNVEAQSLTNGMFELSYPTVPFFNMEGTVVASNRLEGSGQAAILVDAATGCTFRGNNLRHFDASVAKVWLMPDSTSNTVIGVNPADVLDEGTDNTIGGEGNSP